MSLLKRLSTTLVSRIDQVVGEIENHDAVIQAALNDLRRKIAEARVRYNQVQRDTERLRREADTQNENARRWRARAVESAAVDEAKALECLRRAHQCEAQVSRHREALQQYEQTAGRLVSDIETSEQRLTSLKQKHTLMRARQSSGSALHASQDNEGDILRQLDDSFDRWEIKLGQIELTVEQSDPVDTLERDFMSKEQEASLRDELSNLLVREKREDKQ